MLGSEILDVAIGLVLVYLLLSFVCSAIREAIEAVLKSRAVHLEAGIRERLHRAQLRYSPARHRRTRSLFAGCNCRVYYPKLIALTAAALMLSAPATPPSQVLAQQGTRIDSTTTQAGAGRGTQTPAGAANRQDSATNSRTPANPPPVQTITSLQPMPVAVPIVLLVAGALFVLLYSFAQREGSEILPSITGAFAVVMVVGALVTGGMWFGANQVEERVKAALSSSGQLTVLGPLGAVPDNPMQPVFLFSIAIAAGIFALLFLATVRYEPPVIETHWGGFGGGLGGWRISASAIYLLVAMILVGMMTVSMIPRKTDSKEPPNTGGQTGQPSNRPQGSTGAANPNQQSTGTNPASATSTTTQ
ncbi:MAG: hypothetical protein WEE89_15235 [Gemmatimonadota bacterium]